MSDVAPKRPNCVREPLLLREQFKNLPLKLKIGCEVSFEPAKHEPADLVFVFGDMFAISEVDLAEKPFYVESNWTHGNIAPPSAKETAKRLMELLDDAVPDPENPGTSIVPDNAKPPVNYYGAYLSTLQEAVEWAARVKELPLSEWPKEYNKPIAVPDSGAFSIEVVRR